MANITINSVTLTPAVFGPGDTVTARINISNTGEKLKSVTFGMNMTIAAAAISAADDQVFKACGNKTVSKSVAAGSSATLTATFTIASEEQTYDGERSACNALQHYSLRASSSIQVVARAVQWTSSAASSGGSPTAYYKTKTVSGAVCIDRHILPSVVGFDVERASLDGNNNLYPDDEGTKALMALKVAVADNTWVNSMSCTVAFGSFSASVSVTDALAGITDGDQLASNTFLAGSTYQITASFGDTYETVTAVALLDQCFVNVHLSGKTSGGVAFGKYSSATEYDPNTPGSGPLFECEYPAVFADEIVSPLGNLLKVVTVDGTVSVSTSSASATKTLAVTAGSGWTPIGVVGFEASQSWCAVRQARLVNGSVEMAVRYHGSSSTSQTVTLTADVLCLRTSR